MKKCTELIAALLGGETGVETVSLRISTIWGPGAPLDSPYLALPHLATAAVEGRAPDLSGLHRPAFAGDTADLCHVHDCARGIALLQLAPQLRHDTYNVASGRATANTAVIAAIRAAVPDARVDLPTRPGEPEAGAASDRDAYLDITRIHDDTGYRPEIDIAGGMAAYLNWLRTHAHRSGTFDRRP